MKNFKMKMYITCAIVGFLFVLAGSLLFGRIHRTANASVEIRNGYSVNDIRGLVSEISETRNLEIWVSY